MFNNINIAYVQVKMTILVCHEYKITFRYSEKPNIKFSTLAREIFQIYSCHSTEIGYFIVSIFLLLIY